ncbi:hypothetical protein Stsp01_13610 [Streptomyces sp. NBRC 13847]|nr:hypothetical protein Stsp01_13610 [Streptomyces sp. NBRC 13847]
MVPASLGIRPGTDQGSDYSTPSAYPRTSGAAARSRGIVAPGGRPCQYPAPPARPGWEVVRRTAAHECPRHRNTGRITAFE